MPYLVVSADSHVGPSLDRLRGYCPNANLQDFDAFAAETHAEIERVMQARETAYRRGGDVPTGRKQALDMHRRTMACQGQADPDARLRDMDESGVAADVIFAGGQNNDVLPFYRNAFASGGAGGIGPADVSPKLRSLGEHIWNRWMVDYVSVSPERLICAMQVPVYDVELAVREVEWGRRAGLRAVNFPAPRNDFPPYNDPVYEPFWSACEDLDLPLLTHVGGGDLPNYPYSSGLLMDLAEHYWFNRRGIWHLIFGGVFERHPGLRFVLTEQRCSWVPAELAALDSIYTAAVRLDALHPAVMPPPGLVNAPLYDLESVLPWRPSDYFATNCFIAGSFMAPFEAAMRHEVGCQNLMWGSDYPHMEGTWPNTRLAIRHALAGVPEDEARMIVGENALRVYGLAEEVLRPIADRIGPLPHDVAQPLQPEEFPTLRSLAFREANVLH
jgi:predicted TIM-barrel fold metal-dependent hydrolase